MNCIVVFLTRVICGQSFQSVLVYNVTNMHAMSYRSDLFTCRYRVNIYEHAVCWIVTLLSAFSRVRLPSFPMPTAMSNAKSLNTSLLEVTISSQEERVIIGDLGHLTFQLIFDAWWDSMNSGSKRSIASHNSGEAPSWWLYLHCGFEETGSPGIICIYCHQVLHHPSEHGTSSVGKHLLTKAHIAKWNGLTVSEVSESTRTTVDETALAILMRQGGWGITIVRLQRNIIFRI